MGVLKVQAVRQQLQRVLRAVWRVGQHLRVEHIAQNGGTQKVQMRPQLVGLAGVRRQIIERPFSIRFRTPNQQPPARSE